MEKQYQNQSEETTFILDSPETQTFNIRTKDNQNFRLLTLCDSTMIFILDNLRTKDTIQMCWDFNKSPSTSASPPTPSPLFGEGGP